MTTNTRPKLHVVGTIGATLEERVAHLERREKRRDLMQTVAFLGYVGLLVAVLLSGCSSEVQADVVDLEADRSGQVVVDVPLSQGNTLGSWELKYGNYWEAQGPHPIAVGFDLPSRSDQVITEVEVLVQDEGKTAGAVHVGVFRKRFGPRGEFLLQHAGVSAFTARSSDPQVLRVPITLQLEPGDTIFAEVAGDIADVTRRVIRLRYRAVPR